MIRHECLIIFNRAAVETPRSEIAGYWYIGATGVDLWYKKILI